MAAKKSIKKDDGPTNKVGEPVEHAVAVDDSSRVDRVEMVSYRADGTPDQTPGFEVKSKGDDETPSEVVKPAPDDEA